MNAKTKELLRENNRRETALSAASQTAMTDLVVYLRVQDVSEYQQEEIRRDILEMVLEAERRGETMEQVIGEDYKTFCDEIVAAVPRRTARERFLSGLCTTLPALGVLVILWIVKGIAVALVSGEPVMHLPLTLGEGVSAVLILAAAVGVVNYICRTAFQKKETQGGERERTVLVWLLLAAVMLAILCPSIFLTQPVVQVWMPAAVAVAVLFLLSEVLIEKFTSL